jgi:hypothetical protein
MLSAASLSEAKFVPCSVAARMRSPSSTKTRRESIDGLSRPSGPLVRLLERLTVLLLGPGKMLSSVRGRHIYQ